MTTDPLAITQPDTEILSPIRQRLVDIATGLVGLDDATDPARYLALVCGPGDVDGPIRRALEGASGCALAVRGIWRAAGLVHPLIDDRYRVGWAMQDLETIATEAGAWVPARGRMVALPMPGDAVILSSPTGGHAFTVTALHVGERVELESVDGGQKDAKGRQWIARMHRYWTTDGGEIWDHAYQARQVHGFVNVDKLRWGET